MLEQAELVFVYLCVFGLVVFRGMWVNRSRLKSYQDIATIVGMAVMWPITLVIECRLVLREWQRRQRVTKETIKSRIRQNRKDSGA